MTTVRTCSTMEYEVTVVLLSLLVNDNDLLVILSLVMDGVNRNPGTMLFS